MSAQFEESASASLSLSRQHWDDVTQLSAGVVALGDWFAESLDRLTGMLAEALDVPQPLAAQLPAAVEALRKRSMEQSRATQIAAMREQLAENKLAAVRQSRSPARVRLDGSKLPDAAQRDPWSDEAERQRILAARGSQAVKHAALAKANAPRGDADAHASTRKVREAMYAAWAKEAER